MLSLDAFVYGPGLFHRCANLRRTLRPPPPPPGTSSCCEVNEMIWLKGPWVTDLPIKTWPAEVSFTEGTPVLLLFQMTMRAPS